MQSPSIIAVIYDSITGNYRYNLWFNRLQSSLSFIIQHRQSSLYIIMQRPSIIDVHRHAIIVVHRHAIAVNYRCPSSCNRCKLPLSIITQSPPIIAVQHHVITVNYRCPPGTESLIGFPVSVLKQTGLLGERLGGMRRRKRKPTDPAKIISSSGCCRPCSTSGAFNWWFSYLTDRVIDWLTAWLMWTCELVHLCVYWLIGWLLGRLIAWLTNL